MKLAKKLMVAAAALAAFGLMGCDPRLGDHGIIDANTSGAEVNYTSEEDITIRELARTLQKHSGGIWTITQKVNNDLSGTGKANTTGEGLMGVVFDMEENKDGTWNFLVVGVGRNNKKTLSYISYFVNIDEAQLDASNFGCPEKNANRKANMTDMIAVKGNGTPYEYIISDLAPGKLPDNLYDSETKELSVKVAVYPAKADGKYNGKLNINFYTSDTDVKFSDDKSISADKTMLSGMNIIIDGFFDPTKMDDDTDYKDLPQNYIGYYCNVYPKQTMTGTWSLPNKAIINEAIEE